MALIPLICKDLQQPFPVLLRKLAPVIKILKYFWLISIISSPLLAQPLQNHILIATSSDSLTWQKLNIEFAADADVPDAVVGPNGNVYVYYQGLWTPTQDGIMVAISANGLTNFTHYQVQIPGTETWPGRPCDPDIIVQGSTFRLYFTGDPTGDMKPETYSATSTDGINFTLESGIRFQVANQSVLDPSLLWGSTILQYFAGGAPPGYNWHAHSSDGLLFTQMPDFAAENLLMANGIPIQAGGYRWYAFVNNLPEHGIRTLYSSDAETWTVESGYRLQYDPANPRENKYVKDPAVTYKNGTYIMYYVTLKPAPGTIPDNDNYPGTPLTISKSGTNLVLSWGAPSGVCMTRDYAVYRGSLPWSTYDHSSLTCTTNSSTTFTTPSSTGSYYYLITAIDYNNKEGSYGLDSSDLQRPPASTPCKQQQLGQCN